MKLASVTLVLSLLSAGTAGAGPVPMHTAPATPAQIQVARAESSTDWLGDSMRRYMCRFVAWC
jgi:hypothetical protein